jgi:hypothetical protein
LNSVSIPPPLPPSRFLDSSSSQRQRSIKVPHDEGTKHGVFFLVHQGPPESDFVLFLGLCSFSQFFLYYTIRFQNDQHPSISSISFAKPSLSQRTQQTDIESKTDKHASKTQEDPRPKKKTEQPSMIQKPKKNKKNNMRISKEMQNRESFFPNSLYTKNEFFLCSSKEE